jgi:membrane fusion protein
MPANMEALFRQEAIEHRNRTWIGEVQAIRPLSLRVLTLLVVVVLGATAAFLAFAQYTHKARIAGVLLPDRGVIRLMPPAVGTVVERRVSEGQQVRQGDVLFVLSVDRTTPQGETQLAVQRSLEQRERSLREALQQQAELSRSRAAESERLLADRRRAHQQLAAEIDLVGRRLQLARQSQQRLESLQAERFVSPAQVQSKAEEVLELTARLANLERERTTHASEIGALEARRSQRPLEDAQKRAELERELQTLAQQDAEAQARHRMVVRAPQHAVVTALVAEPGQTVAPDAALALLVPIGSNLQAQLFAPSSAVGFLHPGQPVRLRYHAYPYQKFGLQGGQVVAVSMAPLQAADLGGLPLGHGLTPLDGRAVYRVTVQLDRQSIVTYGQERALTAGMEVEADVEIDRRRLIEWIFEPLVSVSGRV